MEDSKPISTEEATQLTQDKSHSDDAINMARKRKKRLPGAVSSGRDMSLPVRIFTIRMVREGHDLVHIWNTYPDKAARPDVVLQRAHTDEKFRAKLLNAYAALFLIRHNEMEQLSKMAPSSYLYGEFENVKDGEAALKRRISAIQYSIKHMSPIIHQLLAPTVPTKQELVKQSGPTLTITKYSTE